MSTFDEPVGKRIPTSGEHPHPARDASKGVALPSPDSSRTKTTDGDDDNDDCESTME